MSANPPALAGGQAVAGAGFIRLRILLRRTFYRIDFIYGFQACGFKGHRLIRAPGKGAATEKQIKK